MYLVRVIASVLCLSFLPMMAMAEPTTDANVALIEKFHASLLDTMKQGKTLGIEGRFKKLEPEIDRAFDLGAMTKFTVGPKWVGMSEDEHKALIAAFRRMTIASYARNFAEFKDQQFTIEPKVEVRGLDRLVKSQIIPKGEKAVNLVYRIRDGGAGVKIIDVIYEFVSQLATKRADFASTVNSGGALALVKKLNELSDKLMKGV